MPRQHLSIRYSAALVLGVATRMLGNGGPWRFFLMAMALGGASLQAQTAISWGTTSNGNWTTGGNWSGGSAPTNDTTTNYAYFNNATGVTVTADSSRSVAGIEFGSSAGAYTISKTS